MGMLDTSTGLLKSLPEKPALSRVGSEAENLGRGAGEGFRFGSFGTQGFGIGGPREGEGEGSGLASPSTSVSSSGGSVAGYEAYLAPSTRYNAPGSEDMY